MWCIVLYPLNNPQLHKKKDGDIFWEDEEVELEAERLINKEGINENKIAILKNAEFLTETKTKLRISKKIFKIDSFGRRKP